VDPLGYPIQVGILRHKVRQNDHGNQSHQGHAEEDQNNRGEAHVRIVGSTRNLQRSASSIPVIELWLQEFHAPFAILKPISEYSLQEVSKLLGAHKLHMELDLILQILLVDELI